MLGVQCSKVARPWSLLVQLVGFVALVTGCSAGTVSESDADIATVHDAVVTTIVPPSDVCNQGDFLPSYCVSTPAAVYSGPASARWLVDGTFGQQEYGGALQVPYVDRLRATGKVFMQVIKPTVTRPTGGQRGVSGSLRVFLKDFPVRSVAFDVENPENGVPGVIDLYIDNSRFTGPAECLDGGDKVVRLNLLERTVSTLVPRASSGTCDVRTNGWRPALFLPLDPRPQLNVASCRPDPTTSVFLRCDAEVSVPISWTEFEPPNDGSRSLQPGIGFGISSVGRGGGAPESLGSDPFGRGRMLTDRRELATILFGPPAGYPLKLMTWNVRRFNADALRGPFTAVSNEMVGQYLAENDVVALQEGWDKGQVEGILAAANERRRVLGLKPFQLYEGPDFEPDIAQALIGVIGDALACTANAATFGKVDYCEASGTHGGLWVMTHHRIMAQGSEPFTVGETCMGEDCLRAKGVQWVRVGLNPPTPANLECHFSSSGTGADSYGGDFNVADQYGGGCAPPPRGDEYVDIFNTHLQASGTEFCDDEGSGAVEIVAKVWASILVVPILYFAGFQSTFNCEKNYADVRAEQLGQISRYIDSVVGARQDRPTLIVGDFNTEGTRTLQDEYANIITRLRVGSGASSGGYKTDWMTPWPESYDWDVDHGDLVRNRPDFSPVSDICYAGTYIGETDAGEYNADLTDFADQKRGVPAWAGGYNPRRRYDFIIARPPKLQTTRPSPGPSGYWAFRTPTTSGARRGRAASATTGLRRRGFRTTSQ